MAQLNLKLDQERLDALKRYASRRRIPVSWLIRDYVEYLLSGGEPLRLPDAAPADIDLIAIAQNGGSFDWLADESDIYTLDDGERV